MMVDTVTGKTYLEHVGGFQAPKSDSVKHQLNAIALQKGDNTLYPGNGYRITAQENEDEN